MPIRRRINKCSRIPYHAKHGPLVAGPPRMFPNVALPPIPRFTMGLPAPLKGQHIRVGYIHDYHWPKLVKDKTGNLKTVRPSSGFVGFSVWLTKHMITVEHKGGHTYAYVGWDAEEQEQVPLATYHNLGQFAEKTTGEIEYEYLGSYFANEYQEAEFWANENAFTGWPNWLHDLHTRATNAILHAAETEFNLKKQWGKRR